MEFKDWLVKRRAALRLSLSEVADRLAQHGFVTTRARIGHWESGRNRPPLHDADFRFALAVALEMSAQDMMSQLGYVSPSEAQSPEAALAAEIIEHLPPQARELAIDYLKVLQKRFASSN